MSIEQQLNLKFPIYWNNSAIEEEYLRYLVNKVIINRPINIVELGGGLSSLIIIKTLEKLGYKYNFTSYDSDESFLNETKNLLISEDVYDEKKISLVYAPIENIKINDNSYKWYDSSCLSFGQDQIDLLFIDGPQGSLCKNSRYPALYTFKEYLKKGSIILLHDAKRGDELEIVELWKKENPNISRVYNIDTERGGAELYFD